MADEEPKGSITEQTELPTFAPGDPTDGRGFLEWKSKYPKEARREMWWEAGYLGFLLLAAPVLILLIYGGILNRWLGLDPLQYNKLSLFGTAWIGGLLGGTLFDMKWLYHVVAKKLWHQDRRLWRVFTPHISGGLGFAIVALMSSGIFKIFDRSALESHSVIVAVSFLVGYFSDSAIGKLTEIAQTLFGVSRAKEIHPEKPPKELHEAEQKKATNA